MKRWAAVLLLLVLPLTLAPRTSDVLTNGWSYAIHTAGRAPVGTSSFAATMWRDPNEVRTSVVKVAVEPAGAWELVAASPGCTADLANSAVMCLVDIANAGQRQTVTVIVRTATGAPAAFSLSSVGTTG